MPLHMWLSPHTSQVAHLAGAYPGLCSVEQLGWCLAQEHNTMSPARTRTRTVPSGDERANHAGMRRYRRAWSATMSPTSSCKWSRSVILYRVSLSTPVVHMFCRPPRLQHLAVKSFHFMSRNTLHPQVWFYHTKFDRKLTNEHK